MPVKKIESWTVEYMQILDETGKVDKKLEPKIEKNVLIKIYKTMVRARLLDDKMLIMQRQGRMGTFGPVRGQEAAQAASIAAMDQKDWMFPSFREAVAYLYRGASMYDMFIYNMGDEWGNHPPKDGREFTISIPIASQTLHAVGAAMAAKHLKKKEASIVYFGDGATSQGDFYEAMNFAGVYKAPVVFLNQNNQWAISLPRSQQTRAKTIAQKGIACGIPGIQVDGNDVLAVYKATKDAVTRAKKGEGPTLIEAITYRMGPHTTADDPSVYRLDKEVKEWEKKDPIIRFKKYLINKKIWSENEEKNMISEITAEIEDAAKKAMAKKPRDPGDMFDYVYKEMPQLLQEQKKELEKYK